MNIKELLGYKRVPNYNLALRGFLNYLSLGKADYKRELNDDYTSSEKNDFFYNCAIITINDFFTNEHFYVKSKYSVDNLIQMFNDNFKLRQFDKVDIAEEVPAPARKMVDLYKELLKDNINRVELMRKSRKLVASVD